MKNDEAAKRQAEQVWDAVQDRMKSAEAAKRQVEQGPRSDLDQDRNPVPGVQGLNWEERTFLIKQAEETARRLILQKWRSEPATISDASQESEQDRTFGSVPCRFACADTS
jgi:hypothetical protein